MKILRGCLTLPCNTYCSDLYCSEQNPHKSGGLLPLSLQKKGKKASRAKHREALVLGKYTDIHPVSSTYACPRSLTADATEEEQSVANHRKCWGAG